MMHTFPLFRGAVGLRSWSVPAPRARRSIRRAVGLVLALAAMMPDTARAQDTLGPPPPDVAADVPAHGDDETEKSSPRPSVTALVVEEYSSNLYHEQRRREDDFNRNDPGERYFEMEGPGDFITEASVEGGLKWKLGEGRSAKASIGGGYVFHVQNSIANYFFVSGSGAYDLTRDDRLKLDAEFIPERFKKNYSIREVGGNKFYEHAYYWEVEPSLGYRHDWTERWKTEFTYELGVRQYQDPFGNRDTTRNGLTVLMLHDFGKVEAGLGGGGAIGTTPSGIEFGIPVDRSYRDVLLLGVVEAELPKGFGIGAELEYRIRHYTTDEPANDAYFERTDRRWNLGVDGKKHFGDIFALVAGVDWIRNDTNRQDHPNIDPEDLGYEEFVVGIGAEVTL